MIAAGTIIDELRERFGADAVAPQQTRDAVPTFWAPRERVHEIVAWLKSSADRPYRMLYDLTAIDERVRVNREGPLRDFTVVYHLLSFDRNEYIRIKTPLDTGALSLDTITDIWPAANWYEREAWDMFGIVFNEHPHLVRILMPRAWEGQKTIRRAPPRWGRFDCPRKRRSESRRRCGSALRNGACSARAATRT